MTKKFMKKATVLAMSLFVITSVFAFTSPVFAIADVWGNNDPNGNNFSNTTGLGGADIRTTIANLIRIIISFLGIIAVVIILIGGFKWMTAGGNEDKVGEAKKLIIAGIIGLVIILFAFAIATFVLNTLSEATT